MRISWVLFLLLLHLPLLSAVFSPASATYYAAGRIPEHTCHKIIHSKRCDIWKCIKECSKKPAGVGQCRGSICFCTYYCPDAKTSIVCLGCIRNALSTKLLMHFMALFATILKA